MVEDMGNLSKVILDGAEKTPTEAPAQEPTKEICPSCRATDNTPYTDANGVSMRACGICMIQWRVAAPQAESAGKPEPETDLDQLLAICEQNGTKWAHFKVSEIAKLRAELERVRLDAQCQVEALGESLVEAKASVTRLTREREELGEILGIYGRHLPECKWMGTDKHSKPVCQCEFLTKMSALVPANAEKEK